MFNILMTILSSFVVIVLSLNLYIYLQAQKKPYNNPSRFIGDKHSKKKIIACIGDSITHGRVSYNYVDLLSQRLTRRGFKLINAGVNGEYAYDVLQRLDEVIKCDPDFITILIGTNDMRSSMSRIKIQRSMKNMEPAKMPEQDCFRTNLIKICLKLRAYTNAKIALLSLPPIGEEFNFFAYRQATIYSKVIQEVALKERLKYIALHETMTSYLIRHNKKPKLFLKNNLLYSQYKGMLLHFIFGRSFDEISSCNGLILLTDFIHLNSKGAGMIADLIQDFVVNESSQ
jgi:lysophospholipase L1-like esterase